MTPNQKLLLLCAVPYPTGEQNEQIRQLLQTPLDWSEITTGAAKHGISQMLFHTIQKVDGAGLADNVRQTLCNHFEWAVRRNLALSGELLRVINLLAEEGITAVPFKGPVLAEKLYANLALRFFGDLDILIHPEDTERARSRLLTDGYKSQHHPDSAIQLAKPESNVILEVHWEAISFGTTWLRKLKDKPLPTTLSHLSPRLKSARLGGKAVTTLSPEDTLLILTIHGSKHWWSRLNWLADIAALVHVYPDLDWAWIMEQVEHWKIRRFVLPGLYLANDLLAAALPDEIQKEITAEPEIKKLAGLAQSLFFVEQNFQTRYIKRPAYFRQLPDTRTERRILYSDHVAIYLKLIANLVTAGKK